MTGTGTQNDPYVVDNWEDFVSAIQESGAYVELDGSAKNKVIDMNEIAPQGTSNRIRMNCSNIGGNGWEIRNLVNSGNPLFYCNSPVIEDISLTNIVSYGTVFSTSSTVYFRNFTASGILYGGYFISGKSNFGANENYGCGMNFEYSGGKFIYGASVMNYTHLKGTGSCTPDSYIDGHDNLIEGTMPVSGTNNKESVNIIFDCDIPEGRTVYIKGTNILLNSDRFKGNLSGSAKYVTSEQLKNAEYLRSIGFPIGE